MFRKGIQGFKLAVLVIVSLKRGFSIERTWTWRKAPLIAYTNTEVVKLLPADTFLREKWNQ